MPQADSQTREIDGVEYVVRMLPPKKAQAILLEVMKVAGPAFASIAASGGLMEDVDLGKALKDALSGLDQKTLEAHQAAFAAVTMANGVALDKIFDVHFLGRLFHLYKWQLFAMEANFSDFFEALKGGFKSLQQPLKAENRD